MRRVRVRTILVAALAVMGVFSFAAPAPAQVPINVSGRVLHEGEPVPCCTVRVTDASGFGSSFETDFDGAWSGTPACASGPLTATATCCGQSAPPVAIPDCFTPTDIVFDDIDCDTEPVTGVSELSGSVVCRRGIFVEPIADCSVLLTGIGTGVVEVVRTDANGRWQACFPCGAPHAVAATAQCCDETVLIQRMGCPGEQVAPTITCTPCPTPECSDPVEIVVTGRVTCRLADGNAPVAGCTVRIFSGGPAVDAVTDALGIYRACVPCGDVISARSLCCDTFDARIDPIGCPREVTMHDLSCPGVDLDGDGRLDACPSPDRPCDRPGPDLLPGTADDQPGTRVVGRLTCRDSLGREQPIAGAEIRLDPPGCPGSPVPLAFTDSDGRFSGCVPCGCGVVTVRAPSCGASAIVDVTGCSPRTEVALECPRCMTCASDEVRVTGVLECRQSGRPVAGCTLAVTARTASGGVVATAAAETRGDGTYEACVGCAGSDPATEVVVEAPCCGVSGAGGLAGCPGEVEVPLECMRCLPCPAGMTRVQGRVICTGGGPVADMPVTIHVTTCRGPESYATATSAYGYYEACVPCPCRGRTASIRVVAECGAERSTRSDCSAWTSVPAIRCDAGC